MLYRSIFINRTGKISKAFRSRIILAFWWSFPHSSWQHSSAIIVDLNLASDLAYHNFEIWEVSFWKIAVWLFLACEWHSNLLPAHFQHLLHLVPYFLLSFRTVIYNVSLQSFHFITETWTRNHRPPQPNRFRINVILKWLRLC